MLRMTKRALYSSCPPPNCRQHCGWGLGRRSAVITRPLSDVAGADMLRPGVPSSVQKEVMAARGPAEHVPHAPSEEFCTGFGKQLWKPFDP